MAGPRNCNYFPKLGNDSAFNSDKYKRYFPYLKAEGLFTLGNPKTEETAENTDLHGNVHMLNPVPEQE